MCNDTSAHTVLREKCEKQLKYNPSNPHTFTDQHSFTCSRMLQIFVCAQTQKRSRKQAVQTCTCIISILSLVHQFMFSVYYLHAGYFLIKAKLIFAVELAGTLKAWVWSSSPNTVAEVAGCQCCRVSRFFFIPFWWFRILSGPRRLLLAWLCGGYH